ncbi:STAS domain-containing protein [Actinoplanes sp. NPDC051859]|uniref:STAS domain-containing protein n=1 Tax=Actinoplanes sp. NPDC051859 TaxID=3363909 RepID=UPI0037A216F8
MEPIWRHVVQRIENSCTVILSGELDLSSVDELTALFLFEAESPATRVIRVDLAGVHFLDSSAIGALITGYKAAQACDTAFTVGGAQGYVRRVLDIAGVLPLFDGPAET